MALDATHLNLVLRCADRFGEYGIVGFVSTNKTTFEVESFFMSCRVQRKRVENAVFQYLIDEMKVRGACGISVRYRSTKRNAASLALFQDLGFELSRSDDGSTILTRGLEPIPHANIVRVMAHVHKREAAE